MTDQQKQQHVRNAARYLTELWRDIEHLQATHHEGQAAKELIIYMSQTKFIEFLGGEFTRDEDGEHYVSLFGISAQSDKEAVK